MIKDEFKQYIEYPLKKLQTAEIKNRIEATTVLLRRIELSATIARTARICLKYPNLAKEYLYSLPKATID